MTLDPAAFPRSPKDLGRWQKWVEDRLKYLASGRGLIERATVAGGVVTIREILTNPTGAAQFENTDTGTCPADGADVPIVLSHEPKPGSEQVFYAGLPLKRADWSRTSTLLTIPGQPWFLASQPAWVDYAYDGTATAIGPVITSPTTGELVTDTTPTITGTGSPGYTIEVTIGGSSIGTTTVDSTGSWSITAPVLSSDAHTAVATQTNPDGTTLVSTPVTFTVGTPSYLSVMSSLGPLWYGRLNEASGTTMFDSSGNSRDGNYYTGGFTLGQPGIIPSMADTCVYFGGANNGGNVAQIPYGSWMDGGTIGLVAWITPDDLANYLAIITRDWYPSGRCWVLRTTNAGKAEFYFWTTTGGPYFVTGTTTLSPGDMVSASYDGTTAKVHVNGAVDGTLTQPGTLMASTNPISIGVGHAGSGGSPSGYYVGHMQGPAIFSSLSDSDVANLWAAGS